LLAARRGLSQFDPFLREAKKMTKLDLSEILSQYHHRLLSLEADLQESARNGIVSAAGFRKRVKALLEVQSQIKELRKISLTFGNMPENGLDVGLPNLSRCTPLEREICQDYIAAKEALLRRGESLTTTTCKWLAETVSGRSWMIKSVLRLSKFRKYLQKIDRERQLLGDDADNLNKSVEKFLDSVQAGGGGPGGRETLSGLISLFQKLDHAVARVAKLKTQLKKDEAKLAKITEWLGNQEKQVRRLENHVPPPTPLGIADALASFNEDDDASIERSQYRHRLAQQFWETVVRPDDLHFHGESASDAKTLVWDRRSKKNAQKTKGPRGRRKNRAREF
jgi:DNA repair exonuclease SbcCD ATPase subunit